MDVPQGCGQPAGRWFALTAGRARTSWLAWLVCATALGCASMKTKPVDDHVVDCRQSCQAGQEALQRQQWDRAKELFAAAVKSSPVDERARQYYAESLWHDGQQAAAIEEMTQAVRLSGGDAALRTRLGQMYLELGYLDAAAEQAALAITRGSNLAEAWALEGDVLARQGQLQSALERYHRALSERQLYPRVQLEVAGIYHRLGRHQRALSTLASLEETYPGDDKPRQMLLIAGLSYKALGRHEEAVEHLSQLAARPNATAEDFCQLADVLLLTDRPESAQLVLQEALRLDPQHGLAQRMLARADRGRVASSKPPLR